MKMAGNFKAEVKLYLGDSVEELEGNLVEVDYEKKQLVIQVEDLFLKIDRRITQRYKNIKDNIKVKWYVEGEEGEALIYDVSRFGIKIYSKEMIPITTFVKLTFYDGENELFSLIAKQIRQERKDNFFFVIFLFREPLDKERLELLING